VPHSAQNFAPGWSALPQFRHEALSALPHSLQNLAFGCTAAPHLGQFIRLDPSHARRRRQGTGYVP
jgi:hypothetical protein